MDKVSFSRLVNSGDVSDRVLTEVSYLLWAYHDSSDDSTNVHVSAGSLPVQFKTMSSPSTSQPMTSSAGFSASTTTKNNTPSANYILTSAYDKTMVIGKVRTYYYS